MIIGLDVGGTHTDAVLIACGKLVRSVKVPTRSEELFETVLDGLDRITDGIDVACIERVVLSTTLTTNAIVQKKTVPVGMIVSAGPGIDPHCFRTHEDFRVVRGAMDHRGREIGKIDADEVRDAAREFLEKGIRHVGVVGKFSVRNPAHERQVHRLLENDFDAVLMGHRLSGGLNFPRRIATTFLNAAVYPIHKRFFTAVNRSLEQKGLSAPIRILKADGGDIQFGASIDVPGNTILSGPAASVMGAMAMAPDVPEALCLDIGGTTTDMAILVNGAPLLDPLGIRLGGHKTLIRSLETRSTGIGGDSAVRVVDGDFDIGPDRLGPALAYGGPRPTPTDALVVLGGIDDGDKGRAAAGIAALGEPLGLSPAGTAQKIIDKACLKILAEAGRMLREVNAKPVYTVHELLDGVTVKPKVMLVLGGPAPYFAEHLKRLSDYTVAVVPRWSVANAIGAALARTTCEVTLLADTELGIASAPEENFTRSVGKAFSVDDARALAGRLLEQKALARGADPGHLETETVECSVFHMVRGFHTTGRNIRVRVQVKPGLIRGYEALAPDVPNTTGTG